MRFWGFIPLAMGAIYAALMGGIILRYRRKFGRSPIRFSSSGGINQIAKAAALIVFGGVLVWKAVAETFGLYFPLNYPLFEPFPVLGTIAMIVGASLAISATRTMGASWEIPIGPEAESPAGGLITSGPFRCSRNPIYLGMILALAGWMLLIPSPLSIFFAVGAVLNLRRQAIEEEKHMLAAYGSAYKEWARNSGRFVPWFGRLR
ncbi:MAG TPA: isoprenylcysteine carboxylmethyltransferase family protein [Candidatus Binataceae bacterium]|nr:isoprenylcysteine carboxylmethyltransferase family protein [Candidatus Binataceae bacterium]